MNIAAVTCYGVGILVQIPFIASALYTGPIARAIGGIDLSWIVGLLVTSPAYYWLALRSQTRAEAALARGAGKGTGRWGRPARSGRTRQGQSSQPHRWARTGS